MSINKASQQDNLAVQKLVFGIEYDGTDFVGWQTQIHGCTIQQRLEQALSFVANHPVAVLCAGRTDAGVHARCQVVHIETTAKRNERAWLLGTNTHLPKSVCVRWVRSVSDDFHARYSAVARRYRYTLLNRDVRPALDARFVTWEHAPLNVEAMHVAAQTLIGRHDFSAFRALSCQSHTAIRDMGTITVHQHEDFVYVDLQANAFLHHMVRNIVGSLLPIGRGEKPVSWMSDLLIQRDRAKAGPTAAASGLCFIGPLYHWRYGLPEYVSTSSEHIASHHIVTTT